MGRVHVCGHTLTGPTSKGGLTLGTGDKNHEDRSNGWGLSKGGVLGLARVRETKSWPFFPTPGKQRPESPLHSGFWLVLGTK